MAHEVHNEDEPTEGSERQMQAERHMVSAKAGDGVGLRFSLPLYTFNTDRVRQHSPRTTPLPDRPRGHTCSSGSFAVQAASRRLFL